MFVRPTGYTLISLKSTSHEGVPVSPGKSQKKGQEDQREVKEQWGTPLDLLRSFGVLAFLLALLWAPCNPFLRGSFKEMGVDHQRQGLNNILFHSLK